MRRLVILLDTSGSMEHKGQEPKANVCAAGAALAALARGYRVSVGNFSTTFQFLRASRDADAIYRAISLLQREGTLLPTSKMLTEGRRLPRDFVLITDTAIHNMPAAVPFYTRLIRRHPKNRALLYVLGDGLVCEACAPGKKETGEKPCLCEVQTRRPLTLLESAGFVPLYIEHDQEGITNAPL